MAFGEARGLAWLGVVGDVTDLSVKVLNANLDPTCMDVQHNPTHTHTHKHKHKYTHTLPHKRKRIAKSQEEVLLILLTMACLNSGLKRDEANSFYEENKSPGHKGQHTHTHTEYIQIQRTTSMVVYWNLAPVQKSVIIQYIIPLDAIVLHQVFFNPLL